MSTRTMLATSHDSRYSYWSDPDLYIYQFNEHDQCWQGWLCSMDAWERTYSKANWITLVIQTDNQEEVEADPVLLDDSVTEV